MIAVQRDSEPLLKTAIDAMTEIFKPKTPFLTATVMDILFNGVPIDCSGDSFPAKSLCSRLENEKPIKVINQTHLAFSVLSGVSYVKLIFLLLIIENTNVYNFNDYSKANGTTLGRFLVNRGKDDVHRLGEVMKFNDEEEVDSWDGDCNKIIGTDSTM